MRWDAGELETSTSKCSELEGQLTGQQQLVARLEEDLLAAEQRRSNPGEAGRDAFDGLGSAGSSGFLDDGQLLSGILATNAAANIDYECQSIQAYQGACCLEAFEMLPASRAAMRQAGSCHEAAVALWEPTVRGPDI